MNEFSDLTAVELDEDGNLPILLVMDETPWTDEEWEEELALYGECEDEPDDEDFDIPSWADRDEDYFWRMEQQAAYDDYWR